MSGGVQRLALAVVLALAAPAHGHVDPPGCSSTGVALTVTALRGDGKVGLFGPASECEPIAYKVTLRKADPAACAISGGVLTLTTPDGVVHTLSDDVPCIGASGAGPYHDGRPAFESPLVPYAVRTQDVVSGIANATARYVGGRAHDGNTDTPGTSAMTERRAEIVSCADADPATIDRCDPTRTGAAACSNTAPAVEPNASFDRPIRRPHERGRRRPASSAGSRDGRAPRKFSLTGSDGASSIRVSRSRPVGRHTFREGDIRMRKLAVVTILAVGLAAPAFADITKCQQGIEKNGTKLQASILKALAKCKDGYRKAVAAASPLGTTAVTCQSGLAKAIDFGNPVSAISKTKGALDKLTPPLGTACSDSDLATLGYLPTAQFGDRWARLILLMAMKGSFDTQQVLISDFPNILQDLGSNGCALCAQLSIQPPCVTTVCDIDPSSSFQTRVFGAPLNGAITGNTVVAGCEWQNVLPNELGIIGTPNLGLKPTVVLGSTVCNISFRTLGITSCAGSTAPKVSYTACQDSDLSDSDECTAGASTCAADPNPGTGGACITYPALPAATQGDAYILSTSRLRVSSAVGPDGVACTPDDTYTQTPAAVIPTTTGTATASVLDYNNANGNTQTEGPIGGTTGPSCAVARSGSTAGLTLVGAFPGADTVGSPLGDTVTRVTIKCN